MFRSLKAMFDDGIARWSSAEVATAALPLAVTALLLEIARADHTIDAAEEHAVIMAVARTCTLDAANVAELLATAGTAVDEAVSLYDFTVAINEQLSHAQKIELLECLWRVAYADGRVHHYEEYYIRKLSDLLHLSHRDFIRTKLAAGTG